MTNPITPIDLAGRLRPFLPPGCLWLGREDVSVAGAGPIDGGGYADVWVGVMGNRKVAVKSYRCYESADHMPTYARFCNEALVCSSLSDYHMVPFVGVYSTQEHPFALVFAFMEHRNLECFLRNNRDIRRLNLLLEAASAVEAMHSLGIVHGNLKIQNILVDANRRVCVAGLGAASVPSTVSGVDVDRFFHGAAPELIDPQRFWLVGAESTKASDVYAFGVIAWQVFAERTPFSDRNKVAGVYSMLEGCRPDRPDHPELSDRLWELIQGCWRGSPAQRLPIAEVVAVLEAELNEVK